MFLHYCLYEFVCQVFVCLLVFTAIQSFFLPNKSNTHHNMYIISIIYTCKKWIIIVFSFKSVLFIKKEYISSLDTCRYGELVNINLVRDGKTGKSRGFCFLCYEDQRSTVLAVDNLNGIKVSPKSKFNDWSSSQ